MKTPPKPTTQPSTELEKQVDLILGRMHYTTVHYETPRIDIPHKIDSTCPYKCTLTAKKAILTLIEGEVTKARILGVTFAKNHFQDFCNEEPHQILDEYIAELQGLSNKEKGTV
jgi:hypothetical protein